MFSRRHPILFFLMVLGGFFSAVCIAFIFFVSISAGMIGSRINNPQNISGGNVGIVEIQGIILSSKQVIRQIQDFNKDDKIKAIILRIDSPGGAIGPSQEIYREIFKIKTQKKVIASMGSVAASGGYYIACAADGIMANPGTITGSIGVIMEYLNMMDVAQKVGLRPVVIKSAEFKDTGHPLRELKENEKQMLQGLVDELHEQFVSDAAIARGMDQQVMGKLADGRVYTGKTALSLELIDRLGNLDDAVQWAGEIAGIKGEIIPVYPREDSISFFKRLADTLFKDINISGTMTDNFGYIIK